eukprot:11712696-Alexandrium_andersonii.AAC.1
MLGQLRSDGHRKVWPLATARDAVVVRKRGRGQQRRPPSRLRSDSPLRGWGPGGECVEKGRRGAPRHH